MERLSAFDISMIYGVASQSLRFYEDQGLLSPIIQDGISLYSKRDCLILELLSKSKTLGFSFIEIKILIFDAIARRDAQNATQQGKLHSSEQATENVAEKISNIQQVIDHLVQGLRELQEMQACILKDFRK